MAATASVQEGNEASVSWTTITAGKFCTSDNNNPGDSYPIPIPTAGTKRSYWKSHCLYFTGTYTEISNIRIHTDGGGFGTGITCYVGDETLAAGSYEQATGTEGDTGDEIVASHSGITAKTDLFSYTSASKKTVDTGSYTGTGDRSKHVVLQLDVASTATAGDLAQEQIVWSYDEV